MEVSEKAIKELRQRYPGLLSEGTAGDKPRPRKRDKQRTRGFRGPETIEWD